MYVGDKLYMLNFVLCDDSKTALNKLSRMLESIIIQNKLDGQIVLSTQSPSTLLKYVKNNPVNVAILDIDLNNDISGLKIAESIRKYDKNIYIIFTTGHLEFGLVAYRYKTFDYIAKPISYERLRETIFRLYDDISSDTPKYIRFDNNKTIIPENSIKYIQRDGMKLVFTTDTRTYEVYSSFSKLEPFLPKQFVRCHKSYIVNLDKIININFSSNTISFSANQKCFIGPKYKNYFKEVFHDGNFSNNLDCVNNAK